MKESSMSPLEYKKRLQSADWYYEFSDDFHCYSRGRRQVNDLQKIAEEKGGRFMEMFKKAQKEKGANW